MRRDTPTPVRNRTSTHNYLFVSDFHLSEGINRESGLASHHEQFFFDDAFARMLVYHVKLSQESTADLAWKKPWKLIFNGDLFAFVQVVTAPESAPAHQQLYGLGNSEKESIWKLNRIVEGHPTFFAALGWFLAHPQNELVLLRGNQDSELHWSGVRKAFLDHIAREYSRWALEMSLGHRPESPLPLNGLPTGLPIAFRKQVSFPQWFDCEPPLYFVEHGHQYDPLNAFTDPLNPADPDKPQRLIQPPGRLWQRYLFNRVKTRYRFAENLRPLSRYTTWLLHQHPRLTAEAFLKRPRVINEGIRLVRETQSSGPLSLNTTQINQLGRLKMPLPRVHMLESLRKEVLKSVKSRHARLTTHLWRDLILRVAAAVSLFLALLSALGGLWLYAFASGLFALACFGFRLQLATQIRLASGFQDLPRVGRHIGRILSKEYRGQSEPVQHYIFGHSHTPSLEELPATPPEPDFRQWIINTGAWIPVFNPETDRTTAPQLTFLRLVPDRPNAKTAVPELLAWKPELNRPLPAVLRQIPPT